MYNFILKTTALCLTVCYSFNAYSQNNSVNNTDNPKNLSWEEKVSPKYQYQLPEKPQTLETNKLNSQTRAIQANPLEQLQSQREDLKFQIARYGKMEQNEQNKLYLDKYRASLAHVEKQIQEYKTPEKKPKSSK
jgi:hypothetical protein